MDTGALPGRGPRPRHRRLISDAEVAEITFTAFASTTDAVTARLIVRRVKDARYPDALFPVWRYHPFFTNSTEPIADADITHRRHAIIETVFADLIDGPLAHLPSGRFGANSAWALCAAITHNLLRAAGTLAGAQHAAARGATLRRRIVNVPARLARPQRRPVLHLPSHWPWANDGWRSGATPSATPPTTRLTRPPAAHGPTGDQDWKSWADQQIQYARTPDDQDQRSAHQTANPIRGSRFSRRRPAANVVREYGSSGGCDAGRVPRSCRTSSPSTFAVMRRLRRRPARSLGLCWGRADLV